MTADSVMFFWKHAGYCWNLETETPEEGKARCAAELAEAESWAKSEGFRYEWGKDWEGENGEEFCVLYDPSGDERTVLASLYGIDGATDEYRRVVEAQLADEARVHA